MATNNIKLNILRRIIGKKMVVSVIDENTVNVKSPSGEFEKISIFNLRSPSNEYQ